MTKILATGKIKPNQVHLQPGGLAGVKEGLRYMQEGRVTELIRPQKKVKLMSTST